MENTMLGLTLPEFAAVLASKEPVPGGGGASALCGALAASLASMVCNLTAGKKRYAQFESDIERILPRADELRRRLLEEIDGDAAAFEPLSRAYSIPKDDPERAKVMEQALSDACAAPMRVLRLCVELLELLDELADKGSAIAVSDVGVAAQLARAALLGAGLNISINTRSMADRERAAALREEMESATAVASLLADSVYDRVLERIGR